MRGDGVLRGQTVAAAEDQRARKGALAQGGADVLKQRLARGARLLGAVEHRDGLYGPGQGGGKMFGGEGAVEVHLHHADLFAALAEVIHNLHHRLADGAHRDHDALGVRRAVVVEELVVPAGQGVDRVHLLLHDLGQGGVGRVAGLAGLEEGVGVLQGGADGRMLGVEGVILVVFHHVPVDELRQVVVVQHVDLLQLVAGTEAVEEVHEGDRALDGAQMRHRAEIHAFLHAGAGQLGKAGLAAGHRVGVVAENGDRVRTDGARGDVHHAGQHRARDAVHRRDHQHQALGRGVGRGKGAGLERAVHRAAGAGLALHLHQLHRLAEEVFLAVRGPVVHMVRHRAGGRDRVDRRDLGKGIACVRGGLIAVHGLFCQHFIPPKTVIMLPGFPSTLYTRAAYFSTGDEKSGVHFAPRRAILLAEGKGGVIL